MQIPQLALRAYQFLFTLLLLALVGNVIDEAFSGNPGGVNWAMAAAVFAAIALVLGIVGVFFEVIPSIVTLVFDVLAALFTLIAGIVLAAELGVHSCGNQSYIRSNKLTNGSHSPGKRCHELQASCAFFWFVFPAFVASAALSAMGGGASMKSGGVRRGGPSMSQV